MDILLKQDENTYMSFLSSVTSADGATADIMVDEMPTASASELKKIYHYIGVTDANYTHGHFYECQEDGSGGYEWVEVEVQVDKAGQTIQLEALPTASADLVGTIYQYVGNTTLTYTNGWFYKCIEGETTGTYEWVVVEMCKQATTTSLGTVKPDGTTIVIDPDGTIHAMGGGKIRLENVSGASVTSEKTVVSIRWTDPPDVTQGGITFAEWAGTKIMKKVGSAPTGLDDEDATLLIDSTTRNAYSSTAFTDNNVVYGTTYYYKFFPYTVDDAVTSGSCLAVTPSKVVIDNVPTQSGTLTYTGETQTPSWTGYNSDALILEVTAQINVGTYTATFTPKSDYIWWDGTTAAKTAQWRINNIIIVAVPAQSGTLNYTGSEQTPTWNGYDTDELTISGDTAGTAIGTYTVTFTPKSNYEWYDGTTTGKTADWSISANIIAAVPTQLGTLTYNGTEQSPTWSGFDSDELTVSGNTGTNVGTYTATFTPKTGYQWYDGTSTAKTADWVISAIVIMTVPTQQGTLTYDGTEQTAIWNNFDIDQLTIANGTGTNAGTYTASFTPKTNHKWSDETTTAKTADFVIGKAAGRITLSTNSVSLDGDHLSATVTVTNTTGDITVTSSDSTTVTVSYSNGIITLANPNEKKGTVTVTVSVAENSNYLSTSATITVTNTFITYGSWSDSSDDNIIAMVAAADAGTLDLSLYWAVGDERTVHLSAIPPSTGFTDGVDEQDIVLVLMNEGYMSQQGIHYVVGQKGLFRNAKGSVIGNSNTWENSFAREALNNDYYNAFDSDFKTIFKTFDLIVAEAYNSSTTKTLQDRFAFFAEKEIWGSVKYGNAAEANELSQIEYYKTSSNRIKHYYNPATDKVVAERWWTRTPHARRGDWTVMATYYDDITYENVGYRIPCAPFGCI